MDQAGGSAVGEALSIEDHPLHVYARLKEKTKLQLMLDSGYDPNEKADGGLTPLMCAVVENAQEIVKLLVARDARLNLQDEDGLTACHWAVTHENHSMVKLLLKLGANGAVPDMDGRTPLHWATTVSSTKCLQVLCKHLSKTAPEQLDARDINDMTPLLWAVTQTKPRHVNALLKYNIDIRARDKHQRTAVLCAAELQDPTCLQLLVETTNKHLEDRDEHGRTPLVITVANENVKGTKLLLAAGAEVDHADANGHSALHWACALGNMELVDMLVKAGANPHAVDSNGLNCLHYSMQGNSEIVARLVRGMEALDAVTAEGQTALMLGAIGNALPACEALLAAGKPLGINHQDNEGRTALHLAILSEATEVTKLLLSRSDVDVNIEDNNGKTPAFYCPEFEALGILQELSRCGAILSGSDGDDQTLLHASAIHGSSTLLTWLLQQGLDQDATDNDGKTPLAYAAHMNFLDGVRILLQHDADVNQPDPDGITALHWACLQGHKEVVQELIAAGAYVNARETDGTESTPFDYAVFSEHEDIALLLAEHGGTGILDLKDNAAARIQRTFRRWRAERAHGRADGDNETASSKKKQRPIDNKLKQDKKKKTKKQEKADRMRKYSSAEEVAAAVRIQAHIRGYKTRKDFKQLQRTSMRRKDKAIAAVQAASEKTEVQNPLAPGQGALQDAAANDARSDETWDFLVAARRRSDAVKLERQRITCVRDKIEAAKKIQRAYRRYRGRSVPITPAAAPQPPSPRTSPRHQQRKLGPAATRRQRLSQPHSTSPQKQRRARKPSVPTTPASKSRLSPLKVNTIKRMLRRPRFPNTYNTGRSSLQQDLMALAEVDPQLMAALRLQSRRVSTGDGLSATPRRQRMSSSTVDNGRPSPPSRKHQRHSTPGIVGSPSGRGSVPFLGKSEKALLSSQFHISLQDSLKKQARALRASQKQRGGRGRASTSGADVVPLPSIHTVSS